MSPLAEHRLSRIRQLIFLYLLLLVFEGVLRKWASFGVVVSSLLLLVRDPVALAIYYLASNARLFRKTWFLRVWGTLAVMLTLLGIVQLLANPWLRLPVVVYGLRCYLLHLPLVLVMARVLRKEDLLRIGRWTLILSVPMALLMVAQFFAPANSFLNRGTLGDGVGQIALAYGRIRPAGTFSYGTGATSFNLVVVAFLLYAYIEPDWVSSRLRLLASVALVAGIPISGSRTYVLGFVLVLLFALLAATADRRLLGITVKVLGIGALFFFALTLTSFFKEGLLTFSSRWQSALGPSGTMKEAILSRFLSEFSNAAKDAFEAPAMGYGLGLASNVGAALTVRSLGFLLAETEWERTVMEMGGVAAFIWLGTRTIFGGYLYWRCWGVVKARRPLAWLLLGTECLAIFNGVVSQTTNLGFLVVTTGLCLAAVKAAATEKVEASARFSGRRMVPVAADAL